MLNCCFNIIILGGTNLRVLGPRSDRVPIYVQQLEPYDETKILQNLLRSGAHATCVPADLLLCLIVKLRFVAGFCLRLLLFVCCGGFKGIVSAVPDLFWRGRIVVSLRLVWLCLLQIKWKNFKNFLRQFDGRFYQVRARCCLPFQF